MTAGSDEFPGDDPREPSGAGAAGVDRAARRRRDAACESDDNAPPPTRRLRSNPT